jgi:glycosyltransferase involved in cell wall biosynthesis
LTQTLLINASNLHAGGGVQVAVSILSEISEMTDTGLEFIVAASTEVDENIRKLNVDITRFHDYRVIDYSGYSPVAPHLAQMIKRAQVTFTVFGPLYLHKKPALSVVGFAQPWIIYPDNEVYQKQSFFRKIMTRIKFGIHTFFFLKNSDLIFVEANHVKARLTEITRLKSDRISVVSNCAHGIFRESMPDTYSVPDTNARPLKLGFVGRDYPHKNLQVLPEVKRILQDEHQTDVDFYVTLNENEWAARSDFFRSNVKNAGTLTLDQCPGFYKEMDAIIFPSLLECFSVTPLEAMIMQKPLLASDRAFVRDFCDGFPYYFDPMSPQDIAARIMEFSKALPSDISTRVTNAQLHALALPSSKERIDTYIHQIKDLLATHPGHTP